MRFMSYSFLSNCLTFDELRVKSFRSQLDKRGLVQKKFNSRRFPSSSYQGRNKMSIDLFNQKDYRICCCMKTRLQYYEKVYAVKNAKPRNALMM